MSRSPRHNSRSYSRSRSRSPGSYRDGGHEEGNCTVFAGNLNHDTNEQGLREFFAAWGKVVDTKIIYDQETGRSRGFGFVKFDDQRDADDAIAEADGKMLEGRPLKCNPARSGSSGRGQFYPRGGFRGGFRGGPPVRGRGGRFGYGDFNNNFGGNEFMGGRGGYGGNYGGRVGYGGGYNGGGGGYATAPPPQRTRRRSYSQSPGRYSPGRYSPGSQSRSASPPPKRSRRSHHKDKSHHTQEEATVPRTAPPAAVPANGGGSAMAPTPAPPAIGGRRPPPRRAGSPSGSSSYTSGSSFSSTDSEASPRRANPPQIRAPPVAGPPAVGSFRKELDEAKQRENEQSMRAAALEAEIEQARNARQETQTKLEEVQSKLQKSDESMKQNRKWLIALVDYAKAAFTGKEAVRAAETEFLQREADLGLFLKEADGFLASQKHRSGRRKRDKHNAAEAEAAKLEAEAQNTGGAALKAEGHAKETLADGDAEGDAAAKFKPGIKFKLAS